ncbi:fatty acid/phospholipid synthesis protein PlsX [Carboxydothermus hydrogenoformans Z-2901]|uniref:Phosphate acyltransferase n=1 Tax=Carboxydothermus hydrogenoformans (strain ATCC BAA-161 / DSM 6008 / Z-2901) TaxID=246194 RepID=PLSX_CARHZ|nr:RecName: Full=Phosphate acyltransferase; AltName: Full=Acyl-ACP phosphotransacylase; AltName: Full=Acyl-[acyl-carrier-protein]--phosphate acyltransferase; AltName: Full=Phosphate-acyl-ACP acyltransferase [Carboxydothermus hydrogenoformans Z-2901]ABB15261.1 fatty acid/phospholipid synthesis protein PlsX [Carboxydothermus hydrogenoformans Z-2901]
MLVVDAMGGDYAPREIVLGVQDFVEETGEKIVLVGRENEIKKELTKKGKSLGYIEIINADEVVTMEEKPTVAIKKKESSVWKGLQLVREGVAQGFFSAGNTGAVMASAVLCLGKINGIDRPAIITPLPTLTGQTFLIDAGANVDVKPENLFQFAVMAQVYLKTAYQIKNPRVALLSNGEEEGKGNDLIKKTFPILKEKISGFIGNIEGKDIFRGVADIIVADGFVGNIVLKTGEGLAESIFVLLKNEVFTGLRGSLGGFILRESLQKIKKRLDYAEYGGAPLLGVNGIVFIAHGRSRRLAVRNGLKVMTKTVESGFLAELIKGDFNVWKD